MVTQSLHCIDIEHGIYILYDTCQTLQSHTCINILLDQIGIISMSVIIKLAEYVVPNFHITVTFASDCTSRFSTSILFSTVVINL